MCCALNKNEDGSTQKDGCNRKPASQSAHTNNRNRSARYISFGHADITLPPDKAELRNRSVSAQIRYSANKTNQKVMPRINTSKVNASPKKKVTKSVASESRPVTSSTANGRDAVSENGKDDLTVSRFRPGQPGFSGAKLKTNGRGYTARPIVPAEKAEIVSVAEAMHREKFGERLKTLFAPETEAAIKALESGVYVGWRCAEFTWDCIRVGETSLCFCGHALKEHRQYNGPKSLVPCSLNECRCRAFSFIPSRPEDVGEFWLQRRPGYDPSTWKAKCRCKHTHTQHSPTGSHQCLTKGCRCSQFVSSFLCAACDRHWEEHETYFDTEKARVKKGLPHGEAYIPFAEIPRLRNMALTGNGSDNSSYKLITKGSLESTSGLVATPVSNSTPVPFGYHKAKKSPFDPVYD